MKIVKNVNAFTASPGLEKVENRRRREVFRFLLIYEPRWWEFLAGNSDIEFYFATNIARIRGHNIRLHQEDSVE